MIKGAAFHDDYAIHLSLDAYGGVGALGMYPGLSVPEKKVQGGGTHRFLLPTSTPFDPLTLSRLPIRLRATG